MGVGQSQRSCLCHGPASTAPQKSAQGSRWLEESGRRRSSGRVGGLVVGRFPAGTPEGGAWPRHPCPATAGGSVQVVAVGRLPALESGEYRRGSALYSWIICT